MQCVIVDVVGDDVDGYTRCEDGNVVGVLNKVDIVGGRWHCSKVVVEKDR